MFVDEQVQNKQMVFSEATFEKISRIVAELNKRLKARACIFADMNGYIVNYSGNQPEFDVHAFTAVAAGSFSTAKEMALMVSGKKHFEHVFFEGTDRHVYMCSVGDDYLMIIVFGQQTPVGFVRLLTHHAVEKLAEYLESLRRSTRQVQSFIDADFRRKLDHELDRAFGLS
ncbi:MAG: roadblock/LC7 domain-containing protein [candidate division KSB1 bacterium]|nr:roadblock/LC7 domain-containing protein [candidate division KSB1 bacterium]MDZ7345738.1 roadblock/LC7 domain-containing protein [candidate division KSB1 bacterium]